MFVRRGTSALGLQALVERLVVLRTDGGQVVLALLHAGLARGATGAFINAFVGGPTGTHRVVHARRGAGIGAGVGHCNHVGAGVDRRTRVVVLARVNALAWVAPGVGRHELVGRRAIAGQHDIATDHVLTVAVRTTARVDTGHQHQPTGNTQETLHFPHSFKAVEARATLVSR